MSLFRHKLLHRRSAIRRCDTTLPEDRRRENLEKTGIHSWFWIRSCIGLSLFSQNKKCSQPPDKPKLVGYAMKLDLDSLARLAGLRAVRYTIVSIQVT